MLQTIIFHWKHWHPTEEAFINMLMEKNNMLGIKYRIYPSGVQQQRLIICLSLCRELHNYLLQYCKDEYKKAKENGTKFSPTAFTMNYEIVRFKKKHPEYNEVWGHALQGVSTNLGKAYSAFFRRIRNGKKGRKVGFPRFKKKIYSLRYPDFYGRHAGYRFESDKILNVSKIGRIPIKLNRAPNGNIKAMTIVKDGNRWYVCFQTDHIQRMDKIAEKRTPVGVDMGIKTFAALSDGTLVENPKFYKKAKKRIKMLQRRHSRKKRDSHNRKKVGMKLWQANQRVEDLRKDFLQKVTTDLVRKHDVIAIEDLKINNMLQNHCLAGSIADAGWGTFKTYLAYKAESAGCQVIYVDPKNTSQTCSCCGKVLEEKLKLNQRGFECPCGFSEDRDINAAKNILAIATLGLRGSQARGETTSTLGEMDMNLEQVVSMKQELYGGEGG
jgi:putative transposase